MPDESKFDLFRDALGRIPKDILHDRLKIVLVQMIVFDAEFKGERPIFNCFKEYTHLTEQEFFAAVNELKEKGFIDAVVQPRDDYPELKEIVFNDFDLDRIMRY